MTVALQGSLLDGLLDGGPLDGGQPDRPALGPLGSSVKRTVLARGAWVDHRPGWVAGFDTLFARLVEEVPWRAERRRMYEREVDVPRLLCFYDEGAAWPDPLLEQARDALAAHHLPEL